MTRCDDKHILEPLIFEKSVPGRRAFTPPQSDCPPVELAQLLPKHLIRKELTGFPELSEPEIVRHYIRLSQLNYCIDQGFYPLGSCTMKYNPKINELTSSLPAFTNTHPLTDESLVQGNLKLMWHLEQALAEISGFHRLTLQPAAGAHGEFTGMMMITAYHHSRGEDRPTVLVPDSAHGTNPASSVLSGLTPVVLPSNDRGLIDLKVLEEKMDEHCAGLMITNPNTLGLFEEQIETIVELVHAKGGLVYCDGANMNALLGIARPGDMGIDVLHLNLHKTFSTPHGGGGPGSGPVAVKEQLAPYLPKPTVIQKEDGTFALHYGDHRSIGKVSTFYGNFGIMIRALTYIMRLGPQGLKRAAQIAVLNANYLRQTLKPEFHIPYDRLCKHECIFNDATLQEYHVSTLDVAKRLIDYGFHPPTIYFPLIVKGALMMEPTETESPETIDQFVQAMKAIAGEARSQPEVVTEAPHCAPLQRLDEVAAARKPILRFTPSETEG